MKWLLIGDDTRSFLTSVRSLGRAGHQIIAAPFDHRSPALKSQFITQQITLPPLQLGTKNWANAVEAAIKEHAIDIVLPLDDRGILALAPRRGRLGALLAAVNDAALTAFFDKGETRALAERLSIPTAQGRDLHAGDTAVTLVADLGLPIAIKPKRTYEPQCLWQRQKVVLVHSADQLADTLAGLDDPTLYYGEAFFEGVGIGLSVLAQNGQIKAAFQHRRLAEPKAGGGSSYRIAEALDPDLLAWVQSLCEATQLHGLAMVEFRRGRSGEHILFEVNARPWGSMPLACTAGVDFPRLYGAMLSGRDLSSDLQAYRTGQRARHLAFDLERWIGEGADLVRGRNMIAILRHIGGGFSFLRSRLGLDAIDSWAVDDPKPYTAEMAAFWASFFLKIKTRLPGWRLRQQQAARQRIHQWAQQEKLDLVILCRGNKYRSPFAAALLEKALKKAAPHVSVRSAGTSAVPGQPAPPAAQAAANAQGMDLSAHSARHIAQINPSKHSRFLVFDPIIEKELLSLYPVGSAHIINLALMQDMVPVSLAITDPDGWETNAIKRIYHQIDMDCKAISKAIEYSGAWQNRR